MDWKLDIRGANPPESKEELIARRLSKAQSQVMNNAGIEMEEDVLWKFPPVTVFKSKHDYMYDEKGNLAPDLLCHDMTSDEICKVAKKQERMSEILNWSEQALKEDVYELLSYMTQCNQKMRQCVGYMFARFFDGSWYGKDNINDPILLDNVLAHHSTQKFIKDSMDAIKRKLWSENVHGFLPGMEFDPIVRKKSEEDINNIWEKYENKEDIYEKKFFRKDPLYQPLNEYDEEALLNDQLLYVYMQRTANYPKFLAPGDYVNGLGLAIHDIWACKINIVDYVLNYSHRYYTGTYRLEIYDNFGLDVGDIKLHEAEGLKGWVTEQCLDPANYSWFLSWFVLQHHNSKFGSEKYRPFCNVLTIEREFAGEVPAKWHEMMEKGVRQARGY